MKSGWTGILVSGLEWLVSDNYYLSLLDDRWELYFGVSGQDTLIFVACGYYGRRQMQRIRREMEKYRKVGEKCVMISSSSGEVKK